MLFAKDLCRLSSYRDVNGTVDEGCRIAFMKSYSSAAVRVVSTSSQLIMDVVLMTLQAIVASQFRSMAPSTTDTRR